jgi:hypothetical protein
MSPPTTPKKAVEKECAYRYRRKSVHLSNKWTNFYSCHQRGIVVRPQTLSLSSKSKSTSLSRRYHSRQPIQLFNPTPNRTFRPHHYFSPPALTFFLTRVPPLNTNLILAHIYILILRQNGIHKPCVLHHHDLWRRKGTHMTLVSMKSNQDSLKILSCTATQQWRKAYMIFMTQTANDPSAPL